MTRKQIHTLESCRVAAAEYPTRSMLGKKNPRVYDAAYRQGWLDLLYPRKNRPAVAPAWTRERVAEVAKLYETRSAMRSGPHQWAYVVARKNGWLEALFPKKKSPLAEQSLMQATFTSMHSRCKNPTSPAYPRYGGRGIQVCQRWANGENGLTGFECFILDMGSKPTAAHSIDRIDNDGNYCPENCRWATNTEQYQNSSAAKLTAEQVAAIRFSTTPGAQVANIYGVSVRAVSSIRNNKTWSNIDHTHLVL